MKFCVVFFLISVFLVSCNLKDNNSGFVSFQKAELNESDKQVLWKKIEDYNQRYDPAEKMIKKELSEWNYHTDAQNGIFHEVRSSFSYAVALLDYGNESYYKRAFSIIEKTISLQDQDTLSKSCGVWPYYLEEPLQTKRSPIDYNWADFNAVSLLDVWMGHQNEIPEELKRKIKEALILAAKSIEKRNVTLSYTNIAIMGTYVTYLVSHLFDLEQMKIYSENRLTKFYNYTLDKGGFTEYNSPTYTIVALNELMRMKQHIIESSAKQMVDSLYSIGWSTIAHHYHKPTGQWAGPHSRSYRSIISPSFYSILNEASSGKINLDAEKLASDVKIKHKIPPYLMDFFLYSQYPRTEIDTFEMSEPEVIGTTYFTNSYVLSTASRSSLWNQRRPFLAYWGSVDNPKYLQLRFLHDFYDFSSAGFYGQQDANHVLGAVNFVLGGGDKHISIDRLSNGKFTAKDLRLRFEFGNVEQNNQNVVFFPNNEFNFSSDGLQFQINLFRSVFGKYKGYWEQGGDSSHVWLDYVIYSGKSIPFDLSSLEDAALGFTFSISDFKEDIDEVYYLEKDGAFEAIWKELSLTVQTKPSSLPGNL